jgi:hypothetical protein
MKRIIEVWRQCGLRVVTRPFKFFVALNDYANILFGLVFLAGWGGITQTGLYQYITAIDINFFVWPGLVIIGGILSRIGFWTKRASLASIGQMVSAISWLWALLIYMQFGNPVSAIPLVLRPVAIASFAKIKIGLDKNWHSS